MTADLQRAEFGGKAVDERTSVPEAELASSPRRQRWAAVASLVLRVGLVAVGMAVALLLIAR
jgi:hypothetical protein